MRTVCFVGNTLTYRSGGGHLWAYLNWALGLRELGMEVIWLEPVEHPEWPEPSAADAAHLRSVLARYDLDDHFALCTRDGSPLPEEVAAQAPVRLADATEADFMLSLNYGLGRGVLDGFRRSALVNIDPGQLESWVEGGGIELAPFDAYFTTAEYVRKTDAFEWQRSRPCVALSAWSPTPAPADAPFTTVTHWAGGEWFLGDGMSFPNDKRDGFLPFLDLPRRTAAELELALDCVNEWSRGELEPLGWRVRLSYDVASSPWDYQAYIAASRGEFSCSKPSNVRLGTGWVSDRTLCYLASGKPAIVQHTGPSDVLDGSAGVFRFSTMDEAVRGFETVLADYDGHAAAARRLAEEEFAADRVVADLLERALE